MPMTLHVATDDGAVEDIECGEQRGSAVALVVWVMVPARPGFIGNPAGCGRGPGLALLID